MKKYFYTGIFLFVMSLFFLPAAFVKADSGLVGYWKFDEGSGTSTADSSGGGNAGTLHTPTYSTDVPNTGFSNSHSLSFGGSDYVDVPYSSSYDLGTTFTLSAWTKVASFSSQYSFLISRDGDAGASYDLGFKDGHPYVAINDGSGWGEYVATGYSFPTGSWHEVTGVRYSDNSLKIFVDGSTVAVFTDVKAPHSVSGLDLTIGKRSQASGDTYLFNGLIDDVRVYNISLFTCGYGFAGGSGTNDDPYLISTPSQLAAVSACIGSANSGVNFKMINDIDLDVAPYNTGVGWTPIGSSGNGPASATEFYGIFNGNKFVVRNLYINNPASSFQGLFGDVQGGATIKNLGVEGANVTAGDHSGVLAGQLEYLGLVQYSYAKGTATVGNYGGGLVGSNFGYVDISFANVAVTGQSGAEYIGGLTGENYSHGIIRDSYARGAVTTGSIGVANAGGLTGRNDPNGVFHGALIINSYSAGLVTGTAGPGIRGFLGGTVDSGQVNYSYWDAQSSGQSATTTGATGYTTAQMKDATDLADSFVGWDFLDIWNIDPTINDGYPYLRFQQDYVSKPSILSFSPNQYSGQFDPTGSLSITFNENVNAGAGAITIYTAIDNALVETVNIAGPQVTGWGTPTITIQPPTPLLRGRDYYVHIDAGAFVDEHGNSFSGILNNTTWTLSTASVNNPARAFIFPATATLPENGARKLFSLDLTEPIIAEEGVAEATVTLASSDPRVVITPSTIVVHGYDSSWWKNQEFIITTVGDNIVNTNNTATISLQVSSNAEYYDGFHSSSAVISLIDDDVVPAPTIVRHGAGMLSSVLPDAIGKVPLDFTMHLNGSSSLAVIDFNADPKTVTGYSVSFDPTFANSVIVPYAAGARGSIQLPNTPGTYTVYLEYFSSSGVRSSVISHNISFDVPVNSFLSLPNIAVSQSGIFNRILTLGASGKDVLALQKILVSDGDLVLPKGSMLGYFGMKTKIALEAFQEKYSIVPVGAVGYGVFGSKTRAKAVSLMSSVRK